MFGSIVVLIKSVLIYVYSFALCFENDILIIRIRSCIFVKYMHAVLHLYCQNETEQKVIMQLTCF